MQGRSTQRYDRHDTERTANDDQQLATISNEQELFSQQSRRQANTGYHSYQVPVRTTPHRGSYATSRNRGSSYPGARGGQRAYSSDNRVSSSQASQIPTDLNWSNVRQQRQTGTSKPLSDWRGPPRKPKQSGYALWVGNLADGITINDLTDHFATDATADILSVFLISKSRCAFVNYRTESSCVAALSRFHESQLRGARMICEMRRSAANRRSSPPSGSSKSQYFTRTTQSGSPGLAAVSLNTGSPSVTAMSSARTYDEQEPHSTRLPCPTALHGVSKAKGPDKYFILKSLTLEDLEESVRNGIWTTQAHNELVLNSAWQSSENVYLIFSANSSGDFFGYARMLGVIPIDSKVEQTDTQSQNFGYDDDEHLTLVPPSQTAPKGRMLVDSARGTSFWEVDDRPETREQPGDQGTDGAKERSTTMGATAYRPKRNNPFKVAWLCTDRLPFHRTRGLRNPWNGNREVKIARDGVELEPIVGSRLVAMFHKPVGVSSIMHERPVIASSSIWEHARQAQDGSPDL